MRSGHGAWECAHRRPLLARGRLKNGDRPRRITRRREAAQHRAGGGEARGAKRATLGESVAVGFDRHGGDADGDSLQGVQQPSGEPGRVSRALRPTMTCPRPGRRREDRGALHGRADIGGSSMDGAFCARSHLAELALSIREWSGSGALHNRALNAARNPSRYALDRASCARIERLRKVRLWRRSYGQHETSLAKQESAMSHLGVDGANG
jgi:hypothetical protein